MLLQDHVEPLRHAGGPKRRGCTRRSFLVAATAPISHRHLAFDLTTDGRQAIRQVICRQARPDGHHPTAKIDSDRRRDDRPLGGNDRADRCAAPEVDIGHHGKVAVNERQACNILKLCTGLWFYRHTLYPGLDTSAGAGFDHFKFTHWSQLRFTKLLLTSPPRVSIGFERQKNPPGENARRAA